MLNFRFFNRYQLLSICLILFTNTSVLAQTQAVELSNNNLLVAQSTNDQWHRSNLDDNSSVLMPGDFSTTADGLEGSHKGVQYFATFEVLDDEIINKCVVLNCEIVLGLMLHQVAQEQNLTLDDANPIQVNSPEYPANGVEFIAKDNTSNFQLKGRIYLVGNRM